MYPLQRPRVPIGPAKLAVHDRQIRSAVRGEPEKLIQARNANFVIRLDCGEAIAESTHRRMSPVVIGAEENGHMRTCGPGEEAVANGGPGAHRFRSGGKQRRAHFIPRRREMIDQNVATGGSTPTGEVAAVSELRIEPSPQHAHRQLEFPGQVWEHRRMTERVRRVKYVGPSTVALCLGPTAEQVAYQRFA